MILTGHFRADFFGHCVEFPTLARAWQRRCVIVTEMTDAQNPPEQLVIDVTIKGGKVTPTNEQLQAGLDEQIVIRVDSDATDELHVHSSPEHTFPVAIGPAQSFQFSVGVPGRVDIELHELGTTIATVQVQ